MCPPAMPAARAWTLAAAGFVVGKLAALALLVRGGLPASSLAIPFVTAWLADALLVLGVLLLCTRARSRRARVALAIVGGALGGYAVLNTYLVAAYGSPLTVGLLAYADDAAVTQGARAPLVTLTVAVLAFALLATVFWRVAGRWRTRPVAIVLGACAALGVVGRWLDADGARRALGLGDNAAVALVASLVRTAEPPAGDARWDDAWPAPVDPRFTAPVAIDATRGRPKHVVVWLAESTGARHTSPYGAAPEATPVLERLQAHALRFDHYAANVPVSAKAIFATLCGLYPLPEAAFEARTNPRIACPSLMETLTARGYDAALFHGGYFAFTDKLAFLEERGFDVLMDGESVPDRDHWFTNGWGIDDAALVEHGLAWLDQRSDPRRPSLAVYIPLLPHYEYFLPPTAARPFGDDDLMDRYRNGVHYTDELFGRLVAAYEARGLLDDTLFVFVGDHGEAFEEHPRNKLHAGFLYEENVHAPLLFVSSRLFPRPQTSARLGSHVDLAATILSLLGIPTPAGMQGQSLVDDAYRYRPQLLATFYPDPLVALRDGDKKYVRNLASGREEIYDLRTDPLEQRNVVASFTADARHYRARLADFVARQTTFIREHPARGVGFLDRTFARLAAVVVVDGRETPCERKGERLACDDAEVQIVRERVFNMERRCLRAQPPAHGTLVLRATTDTPVRTIGVGLTDRARLSKARDKGAALRASFAVGEETSVELVVDDRFEATSKVRALATGGREVVVTLDAGGGKDRSACVTLAP